MTGTTTVKTIRTVMPVVVVLLQLFLVEGKKSLNMDEVDVAEWGLPADDKYSLTYQLTKANFAKMVLQSRDAWIVVIRKGKFHGKWKRNAEFLKGSIFYGDIDYNKEKHLAETWVKAEDLSDERLKLGVGLVFPYGKTRKENLETVRNQWPRRVYEPKEAEDILKNTIPDRIKKFTFAEDDMENFQKWIMNAYYQTQPPRFPVLCITDEPEPIVPVSTLAISNYFGTFFTFGLVRKENVDKMIFHLKEVPPPEDYPHYLILLGKEPSYDDMQEGAYGLTFNIFPFNHKKYGIGSQFQSVVKYLYTGNEDYREMLPGRRSDEPNGLKTMATVTTCLNNRFKNLSNKRESKKKKKKDKEEL